MSSGFLSFVFPDPHTCCLAIIDLMTSKCWCFPIRRGSNPSPEVTATTYFDAVLGRQSREESTIDLEMHTAREDASALGDRSTDAMIMEEVKQRLATLNAWIEDADNSFVPNGKSGDVDLAYKPKSANCHHLVARGEVLLEGVDDVGFVLDAMTDREGRSEWDVDIINNVFIRDIGIPNAVHERAFQVYNSFKGRFGFPGRDFVWDVYVSREGDEAVHLTFSHHEADCPQGFAPGQRGNLVRGETFIGGYRITKEGGGVRMLFLNQTDIRGNFPDWLSNSVIKKSPEKMGLLAKFILKKWRLAHAKITAA